MVLLLPVVCLQTELWTLVLQAMCYDRDLFVSYQELEKPEKVTLGDGRKLECDWPWNSIIDDEVARW